MVEMQFEYLLCFPESLLCLTHTFTLIRNVAERYDIMPSKEPIHPHGDDRPPRGLCQAAQKVIQLNQEVEWVLRDAQGYLRPATSQETWQHTPAPSLSWT
jgi:hypothetical protein